MPDMIQKHPILTPDVFITSRVRSICAEDPVYLQDSKDLKDLTARINNLGLNSKTSMLIADCLACSDTVSSRAQELAYITGFCDALTFFCPGRPESSR